MERGALMPGRLFLLVGPSGVGKDTVINALRARAPEGLHFVQRVITRPRTDDSEDFEPVAPHDFDPADFVLSWPAHGLHYGLRHQSFAPLDRGEDVILNASRKAIPAFEDRFDSITVIHLTAPAEVLTERLLARGRETREEISNRLGRSVAIKTRRARVLTIDNSGKLSDAVDQLAKAVMRNPDKD
ncbi:MAG: phosphonate metabolism protein/1,5-bisphosphokinase (PRPP-forming) PhnN [Alphaproteobacteria bacterium TMED89]|nr:phosphonate metabolism protein/1,5-bisphosphokinase (PRPP-forming) PhnN [Rhodospirillaceae bacterium]RPH13559.1 MAG: phosphonate metabolism protein/1,5-bisphosphokinase (PRPP-forming) PhnN [Alphaproteobacteria bacterium TMED89]